MKISIEISEEKAQEIAFQAVEAYIKNELEYHLMDEMSEKIWNAVDPQIDIFIKSDRFVALVTSAMKEIEPMIIKGMQKRFTGEDY